MIPVNYRNVPIRYITLLNRLEINCIESDEKVIRREWFEDQYEYRVRITVSYMDEGVQQYSTTLIIRK